MSPVPHHLFGFFAIRVHLASGYVLNSCVHLVVF